MFRQIPPTLETVVSLVEFEEGPGLRIDIRIPWDRLKGLAQQIRWWSRRLDIPEVRDDRTD